MKKAGSLIVVIASVCLLISILRVFAQDSLASWAFFVEVTPRAGAPSLYDMVVPLEVMDKSLEDLADLRLYNDKGSEIPYALRIRRDVEETREVETRVFNQGLIGSKTSETSVDLGESAGEHDEVEIETLGSNFRRRVEIEGSDSGKEWRTLRTGEVIFRFESENKTVQSNRVNYPTSRYRYLRVRVFGDELTDKQAPIISGVKVNMAVREKGELMTWSVPLAGYQFLRNQGSPASSWTIDLGGRAPCDRLSIEIDDESFSRSFQIDAVDDPQNIRFVGSGDLSRRVGEPRRPLILSFEHELYARKLRLLITDFSNRTLSISSIKPAAPARQIVFELKEPSGQPLRLYFGNPKSTAPHYDFEKDPRLRLSGEPIRCVTGDVAENPSYKPEPPPLTERVPWLIYVVLTASSLALLTILFSLARRTIQRGTQQVGEPDTRTSS